jgi:hypothetical protein
MAIHNIGAMCTTATLFGPTAFKRGTGHVHIFYGF